MYIDKHVVKHNTFKRNNFYKLNEVVRVSLLTVYCVCELSLY